MIRLTLREDIQKFLNLMIARIASGNKGQTRTKLKKLSRLYGGRPVVELTKDQLEATIQLIGLIVEKLEQILLSPDTSAEHKKTSEERLDACTVALGELHESFKSNSRNA